MLFLFPFVHSVTVCCNRSATRKHLQAVSTREEKQAAMKEALAFSRMPTLTRTTRDGTKTTAVQINTTKMSVHQAACASPPPPVPP